MFTVIIIEGGGICQGERDKLGHPEWDERKEDMWDGEAYINFSSAPSVCCCGSRSTRLRIIKAFSIILVISSVREEGFAGRIRLCVGDN